MGLVGEVLLADGLEMLVVLSLTDFVAEFTGFVRYLLLGL